MSMDDNRKAGSVPVPGEERYLKQMLDVATKFGKRIAHPADWEDVRGFIAVDITVAIRRHLASGKSGSVKGVVMQTVVNRIRKVRARRLTREKHSAQPSITSTTLESQISEIEVIARFPSDLRKLVEFLVSLGRPVELPGDTMDIVFNTNIEPENVENAVNDVLEVLNGLKL